MARANRVRMTSAGPLRTLGATLAGLAGFGAACVAYGHFVELNAFRLRRVSTRLLPVGTAPLRILHVSDMHLQASQYRKQQWVATLAGLEPDLVVSTGDHISQPAALDRLEDTFGRLLDAPGVFVFGSNDYVEPTLKNPVDYVLRGPSSSSIADRVELPTEQVRELLVDHGWHDLNNATTRLGLRGHTIEVRGTDDPHIRRDDYAAVAGPADPTADLHIGVTHAPYSRVLDAMTGDGMDLVLAGHTHGGQVCAPVYGALVTNCDLDRHRVKGLSTHTAGDRTAALHVSAGLGTSPFAPYRFSCPPEATLLTLLPRQR